MSSTDQGGGNRRSGIGNHFSSHHSQNSNSILIAAIPASKLTGPNQSIFTIASAYRAQQRAKKAAGSGGRRSRYLSAGTVCCATSGLMVMNARVVAPTAASMASAPLNKMILNIGRP